MYRCTECGCEYEVKPDFCDCGNDEFINVSDAAETVKHDVPPIKTELPKQEEKPKPQPAKAVYTKPKLPKRTFSEQYPALSDFLKSLDPISVTVFLLCLIFSCVIILYKPDIQEKIVTAKEQKQVTKDIPHINKLWNSELPKVEKKPESQEEQKVIPEIKKVVQTITPPVKKAQNTKTTQTQKPVVQTKQKQTTQKQAVSQTKKTVQPVANTSQKTQTVQKVQSVQQPQKTQTVQPVQQVQTASQPQPVQKAQTVQTTTVTVEDTAKKTAQAKQELANYKAALRNTIGRKIDFTKVVGDGTCVVSFRVASSGKLINRAFTKQSSNITLNDAVYAAVMATPSYNPPPAAYNNETLSITITFYNGNFEISIK